MDCNTLQCPNFCTIKIYQNSKKYHSLFRFKNHREMNFFSDICKLHVFDLHSHHIFRIKETLPHILTERITWFLEAMQALTLQTSCKEKPEFQGLYLYNQNAFELIVCSSCRSSLILMQRSRTGTHFYFRSIFVIDHIKLRQS